MLTPDVGQLEGIFRGIRSPRTLVAMAGEKYYYISENQTLIYWRETNGVEPPEINFVSEYQSISIEEKNEKGR